MSRTARAAAPLATLVLALSLAACSGGQGTGAGTPSDEDTSRGAAAPGDVAGFEEFPIGDDIELGPLNVAGVYFQPVDMEPAMGLSAAESDIHIEADISALENDLGYGVGDWVGYLTVDYEVVAADGTAAAEGTFMPMNASDGPHYGANIALPNAGTYTVRFTIQSPERNGYLLHTDETTGVSGTFWDAPLVAEWTDFEYIPQEW